MRGEIAPDRAAAEAEAEICRLAPLNAAGQPVVDLIFLGMGEDGHVASGIAQFRAVKPRSSRCFGRCFAPSLVS